MSSASQEQQEIIADIQYLEYLINADKQEIKNNIKLRLQGANDLENKIEAISDQVAYSLASMSARINILEKAMVAEGKIDAASLEEQKSNLQELAITDAFVEEIKLSIVEIGEENTLGYLKHNEHNVPYHELFPGASIVCNLPINRASKKTLAVDVVKVSDKSLLNNAVIKVDGVKLKHKVTNVDGLHRLIAHVPEGDNLANKTHVELILPTAVKANQSFEFYLSDIHCVPRATVIGVAKQIFN